MARMPMDTSRAKVACGLLLLVAALVAAAPVNAADRLTIEPAIDRAVAHLETVQLPDGGFGSRLPVRDSATAGEALRLVRPDSPAVAQIDAYLAQAGAGDVDSLSRITLGSPPADRAGALLAAQREDGGFGLSAEYQSDALDTALALRALAEQGERDAARRAADRLLKFAAGGVWGQDGGSVGLTGEALLALEAYARRFGSTAAIDATRIAAVAWLGGEQDDAGTWAPGPLAARSTAHAVTALSGSLSEVARVSAGADALLAGQQPDGSWGDPFSTALAIRALRRAGDLIERDRADQVPDPLVRARDLAAIPQVVDSGDPVTVKATFTNGGRADASGLTAEFFLDDPATGAEPLATADVADLAPGARDTVTVTFPVDRPGGRARVYAVVRAPVDADRDLTNNTATLPLFVRIARHSFPRTRDWPRPSRDMQRSGTTPNRLHPVVDADPIWRAPADGGHIVAEGNVYFGEDGRVTARDAVTGALAWQRGGSYLDDRYRAPVYSRGFVFTAQEGQAGPLNANTGEPFGGVGGWGGSVPVFAAETIPVEGRHDPTFLYMANLPWINFDNKCHLVPYRDPTGLPWNQNAWSGVSPIFTGSGADGWMFFRHLCDGDPLAFSGDGPRAFMTNGAWVSAFDPATGRGPNGEPMLPLFDTRLPDTTKVPGPALVDSFNQVIVAGWEGTSPTGTVAAGTLHNGRGRVTAVDPADGTVYWSFSTNAKLDGTPVEYKGTVILVDRSGRVYGLDQITGALKWSWLPGDYVPPAPDQQGKSGQTLAISNHYLYVPHPDGRLYTLDARDGSQISSTQFPARPYELAIDDTNNAIYVRTLDGFVGAYRTHEHLDQCAPDPPNVSPVRTPIDLASVLASGAQSPAPGTSNEPPSMSADGRYVAYATNSGAPNYTNQVHIRDLHTGTTESLPVSDQVTPTITRTEKHLPVLSEDGRFVGFIGRQRDTHTGSNTYMMFVQDRQTGVVEPVLRYSDGAPQAVLLDAPTLRATDRSTFAMSISGDGRKVAFSARTNDIVPGDTDGTADVFVVDRVTGERTLVSKTTGGLHVTDAANSPALSRDGRFVVFTTTANLTGAPVPTNTYDKATPYVYRYELATGELLLVSRTDAGMIANGNSPRLSGDGRFVAFVSMSPSLYPPEHRESSGWEGRSTDVFVWDATTRHVDFVSFNDSGRHARNADLARPAISDDGQLVAFHSRGTFAKGTNTSTEQVVTRDRATGKTRLISYNEWGVSGTGQSLAPAMSADGSRVAFVSTAPDLAPADTNGGLDVFVYERSREGAQPADPSEGGGELCPIVGDDTKAYADLSVAPADIEPLGLEMGQPGEIRVTVHNELGATSEPTTVRLYEGTTLIGERPIEAIPGGGTAQPTFTWARIARAGTHTLRAVVDPDGLVYEQDLVDNEAEAEIEVAAPRLDVEITTDRPGYGANTPVEATARLVNHSLAGRDVRVALSIEDADGEPVADLADDQVHMDAGGEASVGGGWNTADTTAGDYVVRARAENADGDELASVTAPLVIEPDVRADLDLRTNRRTYQANDRAALSALVVNRSVNSALDGARVQIAIAGTGDAWDLPAGEIMLGRSTLVTQERSLRGVAPGLYDVTATLLAADGTQIATDSAQFEVASTAVTGAGLSGTLAADPSDPHRYARVTFPYEVTNDGNADVEGATVQVRLSDLESGETLMTLQEPRAIVRGAPATGALTGFVGLAHDRDYQASLHVVLPSGTERALARTMIRVRPKLLDHGASFDPAARDRVLVWACDRADEAAARAALGSALVTIVPDRADPLYANKEGCRLYRSEEHDRFVRLMRSGDFNQFWLLGHELPFDLGIVDDELAARVIQGDGLLIAGGEASLGLEPHVGANQSPLGASLSGLAPPGAQRIDFNAGSPFAGLGAAVTGPFTGAKLNGATAIATTSWTVGGLAQTARTVTTGTLHRFGRGSAVYLAPSPNAFVSPAAATAVLGRAAQVLRAAAEPPRGSGLAWLDVFVEGVAPGSPLELRTQLPAGTSLPRQPADATFAGGVLTLPFDATGVQRRQRGLWLKLPPDAGDLLVSTSVFYRDPVDGQTRLYGEPYTTTLHVAEDKASARAAALAALAQVGTPNATEQAKLQTIEGDVAATATDTSDPAALEARIDALLEGIGTLETAAWTNTGPARTAVAHLVTYVEYDHYRTGGA